MKHFKHLARTLACLGVTLGMLGVATLSNGATTDIANAPLFTSSATAVKPNIMFVLDDSGSMKYDYLPDVANFATTKYGKFTAQCNGVAYNPDIVYSLPVDATGTKLAAGSMASISNPTKLSNVRAPTTTSADLTTVLVGTTYQVLFSGTVSSDWYSTGDDITFFQNGDSTRWFEATVTDWNRSAKRLQFTVNAIYGVGTLSPLRVADGTPKPALYYKYTGSQPKLSYTYSSATSTSADTTSQFYRECNSVVGVSPGSSVFTPVVVTSFSAEAQNYANWYQYYSNRMQMMKSSVSIAFKNLDSRYRLGYSTISSITAVEGDNFLDIRDLTATQKSSFYTKFNAANPSISTPLRGALAKAGQYYAKKAPSQTVDPMQYSCQRNFTILSTDGYWNTGYEENEDTPRYGAYQLDNQTLVGQQDGAGTLRPMLDGNTINRTFVERYNSVATTVTAVSTPRTATTVVTQNVATRTPVATDRQYVYTRPLKRTVAAAAIPRPGGSTVVVTLASHGFVVGDQVVISAGTNSVAGYLGTFSVSAVTATTFSYVAPSRPASHNTGSTYNVSLLSSNSCPVGQGIALRQLQIRDEFTNSTSTTVTTTATTTTTTVTTTRTQTTPMTHTVTYVNGVVVTDNTVAGTTTTTNTPVTTTAVSPAEVNSNTTTVPGPNSTGTFADSGAETSVGTCSSAAAPATETLADGPPSTTTPTVTTTGGTVGPTNTTGTPTTVVNGPNTVESARTTTTDTTTSVGGASNTLADIAAYYYNTDLRTAALNNCTGTLGGNVCENNVPGTTSDAAHSFGDSVSWQHMTTYTLGLGAGGLLKYDQNYQTLASGDFFEITNGARNWPNPISGSDIPAKIDDLWHAAVNGRGQYFSAGNPEALTASLSSALDSISAITGAASAASTSALQPVQGDNDIFVAQFTSKKWIGDVISYKIDPTSGVIATTPTWQAKTWVDAADPEARVIYYRKPTGTTPTLRAFTYANLASDNLSTNFDNFCNKPGAGSGVAPTQCATLNTADKASANVGANLVNYLRGNQSFTMYRQRESAFGDVINASPLYVGKPAFQYVENGYQAFASASTRPGMVYAAANDGMLHALDRETGAERWAYIPSFVIPKLYVLADTEYTNNHTYFVDGSPQMGDIFVDGAWKTILVGGLNAGGRGYYALDITDPTAPKVLWEFSETDLGLTFGNPIITKRLDGTWVVVFASGYNNVSPGDGNGHLYMINANTGALIKKQDTYTTGTTPAGTTTTPSGLTRLNAWVESERYNQATRFYGADLLGNLWRFDTDSLVQPYDSALRLAQFQLADGTVQPVTTRPLLAEINYNGSKYPVIYVGTGRYLGTADLTDVTQQSIYAIKDPLTNTSYGDVRTNVNFVLQTFTAGTDSNGNATRTASTNPVNWGTKAGWKMDFLGAGERVSVNPQLILNSMFIGTNVPSTNACTVGGSSFLYTLDISTGSAVSNATGNLAGVFVGNILVQGLTTVQLGGGGGNTVSIVTRSDGTLQSIVGDPPPITGALRRTAWRELVD